MSGEYGKEEKLNILLALRGYFFQNRWLFVAFTLFFILRLQLSFLGFIDFTYDKYVNLDAKIVNQYRKYSKRGDYYVLKLKTKKLTFYTVSRENLKNLLNENINITVITSRISFLDYMFTFYAPSFNIRLKPLNIADEYIESQHTSKTLSNIFKALFLGESIDYDTRMKLSTLGVSHLIALSGLHLGFVSLFLYLFLTPLYKVFQKFFPYRNRFADLAVVIFAVEFVYLYITGFSPSLIRAYVLEIIVFLYAYYLKNPFSLKVLGMVFVTSLLFFGEKVFTLGYFLSITGVFYIYLFFKYFKPSFKSSVLLSFYMFCMMFVVSHSFFGNYNNWQLFSPFSNIVFSFFYPLEAVLHLIGHGGFFDGVLLKYLDMGASFTVVKFPLWAGVGFVFLSIAAFFSKKVFYGINLLSLATIIYVTGVSIV